MFKVALGACYFELGGIRWRGLEITEVFKSICSKIRFAPDKIVVVDDLLASGLVGLEYVHDSIGLRDSL